jgi:hypothetical protein
MTGKEMKNANFFKLRIAKKQKSNLIDWTFFAEVLVNCGRGTNVGAVDPRAP